jgi:putative photosynthetic complex assembly protein
MTAAAAPFPRLPLTATIAVLAGVLALSAAARFSGMTSRPAPAAVIASTELTFTDLADGGVAVKDFPAGRTLEIVPPRGGGFLRSTMRVLATERGRENIGDAAPFTLSELQGSRLQLIDPATGQVLELEAFGPTNEAEFLTILKAAETTS